MATLRQYYETDFATAFRVDGRLSAVDGAAVEVCVLYDFVANASFMAIYVPEADRDLLYLRKIVERLLPGRTQVHFGGNVRIPLARYFDGSLRMANTEALAIDAQFFGDPEWISKDSLIWTTRAFLYSETDLAENEIAQLKDVARKGGLSLQFRSSAHREARTQMESPLAFISHDTSDKDDVARPIAIQLQSMMCPVWYDEFSLSVGDNLRESIEKGLKECKKCILVLSPAFFANQSWTKREFDSIFTRELLEKSRLILPVWHGVTSQQVYDYSPSLANVFGLDWSARGAEEVCKALYNSIITE